MFIVPCCREKN